MRTITHSELRNGSSQILREVENGETMLVSNRGRTVAVIGPASKAPTEGPRLLRPATSSSFQGLRRYTRGTPSEDIIAELRGDN